MKWWKAFRLLAAWLVGLYLARMYVGAGIDKFDPTGFWAEPFVRWGYPVWLRVAVGSVETVGGIAILIPWVATYGGVAVAAVMGGAAVTRLMDGRMVDAGWILAFLAALLWIAWEWRGHRVPRGREVKEDAPLG